MKKGLKILLIVIAVIAAIVLAAYLLMKNSADKALSNIVFENVDMAQSVDGTYIGETDAGMVYVKVAVTVENHAVTDIDILEHKNGRGAKAEAITDTIIADNSYDVDDVSGATLSSKAIKSAVSKALKQSCGT
ncbi:MAG: hypothetical protein CVU91_11220 [Firmicutes bacterium HGW-Firmicutes-16]|nr:MAG: hypothetical protein CVU91_11220 [Firmicutes bacterium HGW-Firmicutes-16]